MRRILRTRATRSILGGWASLLVLLYAVVPGIHVHTCESATHAGTGHAVVADAAAADAHGVPAGVDDTSHDCGMCRLLSHTGALTPDVATPAFLVANDLLPAADVAVAPFGEPLRDDLGRGPPARTR